MGVCAGLLAGGGFAATLEGWTWYCYPPAGHTGCGDSYPLVYALVFVFWMLVAGGLLHAGFRMARAERSWSATGVGSGLWVVLIVGVVWFKAMFLEMYHDESALFLMEAEVVTAGVAYLVAALTVGRARTW
ncbi:hypothetical protein UK23_37025 [Lentzea aerocolonigenes]|uniref:Integral membrane protein n=1 Tax=Lentzea aerocolonigenes TaxID=68170 RepID=A0A0F0GG52_LENAE|nr:hypothetical protein UK23_37025 [Lentzea aerocolonigenes]